LNLRNFLTKFILSGVIFYCTAKTGTARMTRASFPECLKLGALAGVALIAAMQQNAAQAQSGQGAAGMENGASAPARIEVRVDSTACQSLIAYNEPPGVEYQPGVDAKGQHVAPADLYPAPEIKLPESIDVPLTLDVLTNSGVSVPAGMEGKFAVGTLTFKGNAVYFNGQRLGGRDTAALEQACRKAGLIR
jgi:hypothetical protein